ncbi:DegT/DnrJ/EryC1/StrS family aminotransferase [Kamptonema cortianum]|nr:DegT/DnrJ/EryC1/StrS family aminotransferase [Geitlerinema splendidum]MDK3155256.1 DegT/DnrJ/EryC1/StrS family aminotransferase [Kamptonema cortianum]
MIADKIPLLDLQPEIASIRSEIDSAIARVIDSGHFIMGPDVKTFEDEVAAYLGVKHAVGVNSGTDALVLAMRALNVKAGDEVITTPFTFFATGECISQVGATPVFVDIDPVTFNIDPALIEPAITSKTKAILPVHLYGHAANMEAILEIADRHGLGVVEDVAQAFGSEFKGKKLGTIGDVGAFSFFPSKNLGAFGDGGLFVTNDDEIAATARMLRVHGAKTKYMNEAVGYNTRLDTIQAAILRCKLPHIDSWNDGRRSAAERYSRLLANVDGVIPPTEMNYTRHVFHQYTIRIQGGRRDAVQAALNDQNIGCFVYYPVPLDKLPVYRELATGHLPMSNLCTSEALSLPIWPTISEDTQRRVVDAIGNALS